MVWSPPGSPPPPPSPDTFRQEESTAASDGMTDGAPFGGQVDHFPGARHLLGHPGGDQHSSR